MKTYNSLYDKLYSFDNLMKAFKKARKGKSRKWYVKKFEDNLENNLLQLKYELETLTYHPRSLKRFVIRDPKTRVIHASQFRDRVVHHALCNIIESIFDKTFIYDSYANRKKKGTHAGLKRFDCFKRKVSQNGKLERTAKDDNMVVGYVLKADIRHYFDAVDHEVLINIIKRKVRDEKVIWLVKRILDNHDFKVLGKGMPIGNLTSQFFANVYLNELDYFVKQKLRAKYYLRYVDDFVILHRNKEVLENYKKQINEFLKTLKLELHPEKSKVISLHNGVNLLGFRIFYYYKLPRNSNIRKFEKKLIELIKDYNEGMISKEKLMESVEGWCAYAIHGNTYKLRKKLIEAINGNGHQSC
jgi:retron-type reverse transcriptase